MKLKEYSVAETEKCKAWGDCVPTPSGVMAYDWGLAGPDGGWFVLIREPHHTDEDVREARHQLRMKQDVVKLEVRYMEKQT